VTDLPALFTPITAFILGLCIGSFLNVCILRVPKGQSVVHPASRCPKCGVEIRWFDNIPVLSWLALGGRCRNRQCRALISIQYPLVELLTGVLFSLTAWRFGMTLEAGKWLALFCILVVHIVTDMRERFLSYHMNRAGFAAGLALSAIVPVNDGAALALALRIFEFPPPAAVVGVADALLGALLGAGMLWIVSEGYFRITGRSGMGLGDVYLMGMVGAFLGLKRTFLTILLGSVLGSILGIGVVVLLYATGWKSDVAQRAHRRGLGNAGALRFALARRYPLPFGTYLGIAAVLVVFYGTWFLERYTQWMEQVSS